MTIEPDRLRELRNQRKMSRGQLAERAKVSVRQIARLEGGADPSGTVRKKTIGQLARALDVEPGVLSGDLPVPEAERSENDWQAQVNAQVDPHIHLFYTLIKRRYGVGFTTLATIAPLMFVLLAEGSFLWRRGKLGEIRDALERLTDLGSGHLTREEAERTVEDGNPLTDPSSGHLSFAFATRHVREGADDEERSIGKCDLFGRDAGRAAFDNGYNPSTNNPFADYLRSLGRNINNPDLVEVDEGFLGHMSALDFPEYTVCGGDLERITGGPTNDSDNAAVLALIEGVVRLRDIPEELWADGRTEERREWLRERYERTLTGQTY